MPIIVNTVLNEHQLVLDIVSFVALGDFPRSRLGEKQRGKVLGNWVSRSVKMRTIAQFSIRDPDAEGSVGTAVPEDGRRGSGQSSRVQSGTPGSALRHVESLTNMPVEEEMEGEHLGYQDPLDRSESRDGLTPTNETPRPLQLNTTLDYSPVEPLSYDSPEHFQQQHRDQDYHYQSQDRRDSERSYEQYDDYGDLQRPDESSSYHPGYSELEAPYTGGDFGGGLRVANRSNSNESGNWEQDALRSMNLNRW